MKGSAGSDLLIVIALLVALGIAWYFAGGPASITSHSGPLLSLPGTGGAYTVPTVGVSSSTSSGSNSNTQNQNSNGILSTFTNYLGTFHETASPYSAYITLERGGADSDYPNQYIVMRVASNAPAKITVTGWRIESTQTSAGTNLPQASALPSLGQVNGNAPVALSAGDTAYIVTGRSPMGVSFRTNQCVGYFEQFQDFTPSLRLDCPSPSDEATRAFTNANYPDACSDIVKTIDRCDIYTASIPGNAGSQCQSLIQNTLTYNGCVSSHQNDPKFYGNTWYLYLSRDQSLWKSSNERIRVVDERGNVVAAITY